jgi:anti-anti-sigma factor
MLTATNRSFVVDQVRNVTVVCFTIETLNEDNFEAVAEELNSLIHARGPRRVVVDLASIRKIDELGLAVVQSFHDGVEEFGGTAILCRLSPTVASAMNEVGLHRLLHIRNSRNEAVWTF